MSGVWQDRIGSDAGMHAAVHVLAEQIIKSSSLLRLEKLTFTRQTGDVCATLLHIGSKSACQQTTPFLTPVSAVRPAQPLPSGDKAVAVAPEHVLAAALECGRMYPLSINSCSPAW